MVKSIKYIIQLNLIKLSIKNVNYKLIKINKCFNKKYLTKVNKITIIITKISKKIKEK